MKDKGVVTICVLVFFVAFAVRVIVWQNNKVEMGGVQSVVTQNYINDAGTLAAGDVSMFVTGVDPPSDPNVIGHPPGYPLRLALVFATVGKGGEFRLFLVALNYLAVALIF